MTEVTIDRLNDIKIKGNYESVEIKDNLTIGDKVINSYGIEGEVVDLLTHSDNGGTLILMSHDLTEDKLILANRYEIERLD